jgi:multiple antibiotic resistance protein
LQEPGRLLPFSRLRAEYSLLNVSIAILINMIIVFLVLRHVNWAEKLLGKGGIFIYANSSGSFCWPFP